VLLIILVFVLSCCVSLRTEFRVVRSAAISAYSYARFVIDSNCLWEGRVLFTLFVFVCVWWCQTHIVFLFCSVCLRLMYLCCQFLLIVLFWLLLLYSLTFISYLYLCLLQGKVACQVYLTFYRFCWMLRFIWFDLCVVIVNIYQGRHDRINLLRNICQIFLEKKMLSYTIGSKVKSFT